MTGNVTTTHVSGGLTFSDIIPDRVHAKVGVAEGGEANTVYLIGNYNQAKNIFVKGELLDSLEQHFSEFDDSKGQNPVPVLCIRPVNDSVGIVKPPVKVGTGLAAIPTITGTPTGSRVVKIKITKAGASGTAEYRKSLDGGITYGVTQVTPASETNIVLDAGISVAFEDDVVDVDSTFELGDVWTFEIVGPGATNVSKLAAIALLKREYDAYWIHVIGEASRAFAVSVDSILTEMEDLHHPCFAILEGRKMATSGETVTEYYQSLLNEYDPFYSDRVSIVCAEGRYISGGIANAGGYSIVKADGTLGEWRNAATLLCAKLAAGAPNVSAAYVKDMRSLTMSEIRYWNEGYRDYMDTLHDARLVVLKEYDDYAGIYIARDRIKSHPDSDFVEIPERRRADKMHRIVYRESLPFLNQDTDIRAGLGGLEYIKATCDAKISQEMEQAGRAEINSHKIILDPDKSFKLTKILKAQLTMYVAGRVAAIEWTTSFAQV